MAEPARAFEVNQHAPDPSVVFDRATGETHVRCARMLVECLHHDETIAFQAAGQDEIRTTS
jgi:hypothetical protein